MTKDVEGTDSGKQRTRIVDEKVLVNGGEIKHNRKQGLEVNLKNP